MQFERADYSTIMSGLVVRYKGLVNWTDRPEISASRDGVGVTGSWPALSEEGVQHIKAVLDRAIEQAAVIKRSDRLSKSASLPFSGDPECVVRHIRPAFVGEPTLLAERRSAPPMKADWRIGPHLLGAVMIEHARIAADIDTVMTLPDDILTEYVDSMLWIVRYLAKLTDNIDITDDALVDHAKRIGQYLTAAVDTLFDAGSANPAVEPSVIVYRDKEHARLMVSVRHVAGMMRIDSLAPDDLKTFVSAIMPALRFVTSRVNGVTVDDEVYIRGVLIVETKEGVNA